jgi:putative alpha-1,2-mannosidase
VLAPWQFSLVPGEEWRTQYWVRWILDTYYPRTADGVPGNDDFGELNAWAVWACLGLYPLAATAKGTYILSSPCFANVSLALPAAEAACMGGAAAPGLLNIVAHNFSAANVYVARAALNGANLPTPFVDHAQLIGAAPGLLEFWLTGSPVVWGTGEPAKVPW